jgi:hypothetical protein
MLNRYAIQKAVHTTADFNTKTSIIKISPMDGSKKTRQECAINYTRYFHLKISLFTHEALKHDTWCNIFCWEHAHYTYVTKNRCGDIALHDIDDIQKQKCSSTHS